MKQSWGCLRQQRGGWTARLARAAKLAVDSFWSVPYGTCFTDALRTHTHRLMRAEGFFPSKGENHERANLMMKSLSVILNAPLGTRTPAEPDRPPSLFRERKGPKRRKTDAEGLPWTFWCSMRWQSHMNKRKMPGWRWCFSIPNMMERQSEARIWHRQR